MKQDPPRTETPSDGRAFIKLQRIYRNAPPKRRKAERSASYCDPKEVLREEAIDLD